MSAQSTLMVHAGGVRRTRDELASLATAAPTATWKPVPHADLVTELIRSLATRGVTVARDDYCTMGRDDAKLFGTMDLRIPGLDAPDVGMGLGLAGLGDDLLGRVSLPLRHGANPFRMSPPSSHGGWTRLKGAGHLHQGSRHGPQTVPVGGRGEILHNPGTTPLQPASPGAKLNQVLQNMHHLSGLPWPKRGGPGRTP
jgi:hypothetical protein